MKDIDKLERLLEKRIKERRSNIRTKPKDITAHTETFIPTFQVWMQKNTAVQAKKFDQVTKKKVVDFSHLNRLEIK